MQGVGMLWVVAQNFTKFCLSQAQITGLARAQAGFKKFWYCRLNHRFFVLSLERVNQFYLIENNGKSNCVSFYCHFLYYIVLIKSHSRTKKIKTHSNA